MIATLLAALLAAPSPDAVPNCVNPGVPGFAPGQARMADRPGVGAPVELALKPADAVAFPMKLARKPMPGDYGGAFPLEIARGGTYRIALSGKAWIDVVRDGAPLVSIEHQRGAPCSGVAKIVAFRLDPGGYTVQISEAGQTSIVVEVMREGVPPVAR